MLRPFGFALIVLGLSTPGAVAADGKRYALLVGIDKFDSDKLEPLQCADRDMTDLAKVLESSGYSLTVLTDSKGQKDKALEPTKANIDKSLETILSKAQKEDLILVAFSAQGVRFGDKAGAYICPRDARPAPDSTNTLIAVESLCEKLAASTASTKVLLVDACRMNSKGDLATGIEGDKVKVPENLLAMFSCPAGDRSIEHKDLKHGIFFYQVSEGLRGNASDGNDAITFASLTEYVSKEAKQTPSIHMGKTGRSRLAMHPQAIPLEEWKEYESVWSKGSTEPFLKKYGPTRLASWRKSAEAGSARGMMLLADSTEFGVGGPKDAKESARWYGKGANLGNSFAMVGFGLCYQKGFGIEKDTKEAVRWFRKSADLGDPGGMELLGSAYAKGAGVEKDDKEAFRWYRKSAELGFGQAMTSVAMRYLTGVGVEKDDEEAVRWFRKGADQGNNQCMIILGLCYRDGVGIPENQKEAVRWFRKSAENGEAEGMNLIADCYMEGTGIAQDEKEGANWYRKSADLDNAVGLLNLGMCYLSGKGVMKSRTEAVRWLRKASDRGSAKAKELLNTLVD